MRYIIYTIIATLLLTLGISILFESSRNEALVNKVSEVNQLRVQEQRDTNIKILELNSTIREVNDSLEVLYDKLDIAFKKQKINTKRHIKDERKHIKEIDNIGRYNDAKRDGLWTKEFAIKDSLIR